ncbi:disulfide bond formation protein B [Bartonella sp. CB74]|uniref:disulfide bond formation protein B n=1 Tax=Bartonella sp. CB74 TaxID=3113620 RepID=UPI002F96DEDE
MACTLSPRHLLNQHLHREISNKEQSLWALFLIFCLSATTGLALGFEHIGKYLPCNLCLIERFPYYIAIAFLILAGFGAYFFRISLWVRLFFLCVFVLMTISLVLAIYHTGIEYGFWPAPPSCSSDTMKIITDVNQLLSQLNNIHPPSCSAAPARFLFLSFAGWNAVASLLYMLMSLYVASKGLLSNRKKR